MAFFRSVSALSKLRGRVGQQSSLANSVRWLQIQTSSNLDLKSELQELIPGYQECVKKLKKGYGKVELGNITVDMVLGGMRGMTALLWLGSTVDPEEGIRFRGMLIPECQKALPAVHPGGEPLPESILWLLLTRKIPSKGQVDSLSQELRSRATVPDFAYKAINVRPVEAHPMTQFTTGVMALQVQSEFQKAHQSGIAKSRSWEPTYEDCMNLIVRLPAVAAYVYRRDHEGGNVSSHTAHLVGSPLADPYLSFAAVLNGLAGPLNGLANQVVPGFGHGVLRKTDPRDTCQREFALKHLPDDPLFLLVSKLKDVVPPILLGLGKVKNPWPNADAHSRVLLNYFGLTKENYFTVLFGVSRSVGVGPQLIWDRALEMPKSVALDRLADWCKKAASS